MYICHAINEANRQGRISPEAAEEAKMVISKRLHSCNTLESWLIYNGGIPFDQVSSVEGRYKLQVTWHAWIDSLIEEFSNAEVRGAQRPARLALRPCHRKESAR